MTCKNPLHLKWNYNSGNSTKRTLAIWYSVCLTQAYLIEVSVYFCALAYLCSSSKQTKVCIKSIKQWNLHTMKITWLNPNNHLSIWYCDKQQALRPEWYLKILSKLHEPLDESNLKEFSNHMSSVNPAFI